MDLRLDGWPINSLARQEKHKFLLVFSDGEPSAFGYDRNGILDTAEAVMETEKKGISVIHLFLSTEEPTDDQKAVISMMFGNKTASSNSVESFTDQTLRILRKLIGDCHSEYVRMRNESKKNTKPPY